MLYTMSTVATNVKLIVFYLQKIEIEEKLYNDIKEAQLIKKLRRVKSVDYYLKLADTEYKKQISQERKQLFNIISDKVIDGKQDYYHTTFCSPRDMAMVNKNLASFLQLQGSQRNLQESSIEFVSFTYWVFQKVCKEILVKFQNCKEFKYIFIT